MGWAVILRVAVSGVFIASLARAAPGDAPSADGSPVAPTVAATTLTPDPADVGVWSLALQEMERRPYLYVDPSYLRYSPVQAIYQILRSAPQGTSLEELAASRARQISESIRTPTYSGGESYELTQLSAVDAYFRQHELVGKASLARLILARPEILNHPSFKVFSLRGYEGTSLQTMYVYEVPDGQHTNSKKIPLVVERYVQNDSHFFTADDLAEDARRALAGAYKSSRVLEPAKGITVWEDALEPTIPEAEHNVRDVELPGDAEWDRFAADAESEGLRISSAHLSRVNEIAIANAGRLKEWPATPTYPRVQNETFARFVEKLKKATPAARRMFTEILGREASVPESEVRALADELANSSLAQKGFAVMDVLRGVHGVDDYPEQTRIHERGLDIYGEVAPLDYVLEPAANYFPRGASLGVLDSVTALLTAAEMVRRGYCHSAAEHIWPESVRRYTPIVADGLIVRFNVPVLTVRGMFARGELGRYLRAWDAATSIFPLEMHSSTGQAIVQWLRHYGEQFWEYMETYRPALPTIGDDGSVSSTERIEVLTTFDPLQEFAPNLLATEWAAREYRPRVIRLTREIDDFGFGPVLRIYLDDRVADAYGDDAKAIVKERVAQITENFRAHPDSEPVMKAFYDLLLFGFDTPGAQLPPKFLREEFNSWLRLASERFTTVADHAPGRIPIFIQHSLDIILRRYPEFRYVAPPVSLDFAPPAAPEPAVFHAAPEPTRDPPAPPAAESAAPEPRPAVTHTRRPIVQFARNCRAWFMRTVRSITPRKK